MYWKRGILILRLESKYARQLLGARFSQQKNALSR